MRYFKDYVEVWGIPQGVGRLGSGEHSHSHRSYRFVYKRGRLLRVSHVNSLDNLIDDGESERNERPIDQEFHYTDNGKASRVVVKDRSGKVLYVKNYNDKLNTMAFQYDDEHGTERTVSNRTVGYGRLLEQEADDRGRISRWLIEYDGKGYATTIRYAGLDNSPVCDENGIYGRRFVRDKKGRVTEIRYIGREGMLQPTRWGLGIKRFYYDDDDNWIRAEYLTIDGQPAYDDEDGVGVYVMEYDRYGNVVNSFHFDHDGNLMYPKKDDGDLARAGVHTEYDKHGFDVKSVYLDADKNPIFVKGVSIIKREYDENGYISRVSNFDPEGNPTEDEDGAASYEIKCDNHGNVVECWSKDREGELCLLSTGYAGFIDEYDSVGNLIRAVYYGVDQTPCEIRNGYSGTLFEYDDRNLITAITYLNKKMEPMKDRYGVSTIRFEHDRRGNTTRTGFFDVDRVTPCLNNEGAAGWNDIYDEMGRHVERNFFDKDGNSIIPSGLHYAKIIYSYDENGNLRSYKYYNLNGQLTSVNGISGYEYVRDVRGNILEEKPIGTDGNLAHGYLIQRYRYDKYNNILESSLYSKTGAAKNGHNIHKYVYKYNSRNQEVERHHYGTDGNPVMSDENWSSVRYEYDDKGNLVRSSYYGVDGKPCMTKFDRGWSSATREYDSYGRVVRQCYFGTDGKPTDPSVMAPVGVVEYDKWGNMLLVAAQDGKGNYILYPGEKWSIRRAEYDRRNNLISLSFFNENDKAVLCSDGYHKQTFKYDMHDRKIEDAYYGTDDQPIMVNGFHKETYKYAENSNNVVVDAVYDTKSNPINVSAGFHKVVTTYNDEGTLPLTREFYRANGSLLFTQRWDGHEWKLVQQQVDWKEHVVELNRECPYDFGEDAMHLTVQSIRVTGNRECEIRFVVPYHSKSQLSSDELDVLKEAVRLMTRELEGELEHKPYVTGNLYDKNGMSLYSVRI